VPPAPSRSAAAARDIDAGEAALDLVPRAAAAEREGAGGTEESATLHPPWPTTLPHSCS
jgi:hypothetical protein